MRANTKLAPASDQILLYIYSLKISRILLTDLKIHTTILIEKSFQFFFCAIILRFVVFLPLHRQKRQAQIRKISKGDLQ